MRASLRFCVIASAPRSEIDLDAAEWHISGERMKMQHDHIVPLPRQALLVLNELKTITGDSIYVFPSPARQKTPHLHRDALSKALRDMGFQGKHATHGFRGMLRHSVAVTSEDNYDRYEKDCLCRQVVELISG
jgi:integrase